MQYQLLSAKATRVIEQVVDGVPSVIFEVTTKTGIVGDPYEFVRYDELTVVCPKSMTGDQMDAQIYTEASALVAAKYPNV